MTDITDAGPRLKAMNDALCNLATADLFHAEIARLNALVESLRREVLEQRKEIAGLREERRALLDADRPQPDRPEAIETGESDRPEPIADARLAALQRLVQMEEELGLPRAPNPHATPAECRVQGE